MDKPCLFILPTFQFVLFCIKPILFKPHNQKPYPHIYRDAVQISPCIRPEKICWNFVGPPLYFTPMHTLPGTQKKAGNP